MPLALVVGIPPVGSHLHLGNVLAAAVEVDKEHKAESSVTWDDKMGEPLSLQRCQGSSLPHLYQTGM